MKHRLPNFKTGKCMAELLMIQQIPGGGGKSKIKDAKSPMTI